MDNLIYRNDGNFLEAARKLNRDTDLEADKWFKSGRKVWLPFILLKMKFEFFKVYFVQGSIWQGYLGFMKAVNSSLYQFISYAKYWELRERERGRM